MSPVHLIHDIPHKAPDGSYQMVVEIPAGTNEKWQTDETSGQLYLEHVNDAPRIIQFLSYPMNYGFIPQTVQSKNKGGDGDPIDAVLIAPAQARGSIQPFQIIGGFHLVERGEVDTKLIGVLPEGPFRHIRDITEMMLQYPGALEILRLWFEGYKGPGSFLFKGYATADEAKALLEASHQDWQIETSREVSHD